MQKKSLNLALQGGGSHGAFTWGVLDYLLEDGRTSIEGISGTSAGAMNATVLAHGYMKGEVDGARQALEDFWRAVSKAGAMSPIKRSPLDKLMGNWSFDSSPSYFLYDLMSHYSSPYDFNPLNLNPLKDLLESQVDFDLVRSCQQLNLFIAATNVHSGKIKIFERHELTADMVMASACIPEVYKAVEIDGQAYWDGGYVGNPPLYPLFPAKSKDIVIVQINPIRRNETPRTAREIANRANEIAFNSSLLRELRSIEFVQRLVKSEKVDKDHYSNIHVHRIEATEEINPLSASSKMNAEWEFLKKLRDIGRNSAKNFLDQHYQVIGKHSSLDLVSEFS